MEVKGGVVEGGESVVAVSTSISTSTSTSSTTTSTTTTATTTSTVGEKHTLKKGVKEKEKGANTTTRKAKSLTRRKKNTTEKEKEASVTGDATVADTSAESLTDTSAKGENSMKLSASKGKNKSKDRTAPKPNKSNKSKSPDKGKGKITHHLTKLEATQPSTENAQENITQTDPTTAMSSPSASSNRKATSSKGAKPTNKKTRRGSTKTKKPAEPKQMPDIRSHFPVRAGRRMTEMQKKELKLQETHQLLRDGVDSKDLNIVDMGDKGKGVVANKDFEKGDFVCEYAGDLISVEEAEKREKVYLSETDPASSECMPCYMYFFKHNKMSYCVDATKSQRIGRLINHSRTKRNLKTKLYVVDGKPKLGLITIKAIFKGEELLYDYGERDPNVIKAMPWLKS